MPQSTLLVVIDPTSSNQSALSRAEQLAVDTDSKLHLFCCYQPQDISDFHSRKDAKHSTLVKIKTMLETLATPLRAEGLSVTTEAFWNQNWQESVVRACSRLGVDMVIKSSFNHNTFIRHLKQTSDFSILRKAPCAILLVKDEAPWLNQTILAAIAIDAVDAEHDRLNVAIITQAQRLATATQSNLHIVAALNRTAKMADVLGLLEDEADEPQEEIIGLRFGVNPERVHLHDASPVQAILSTVDTIKADVLVIGTVARHGLKAAVLGNTAEKVLDCLEVDVLTVN